MAGTNDPRVVVTGIGLLTSLGRREESWGAMRLARSGARWLHSRPGVEPGTEAGYAIPDDIDPWDPAFLAAWQADADAGMTIAGRTSPDPDRVGVVVGLSKGDIGLLARVHRRLSGRSVLSDPGSMALAWPNAAASFIARVLGYRGPCLAPIAACATGVIAAIQGADLIRRGLCDIVLAGAGDASLHPLVLGAFRKMRALAQVGGDPSRAVRPWDKRRSGFLPGEGAAVLVLERADHAKARGILPYAEFAGGAFGSDAYHLTDLNPDPANLAHVIGLALKNAEAQASDLDYINVHGTATRQNDPLECRAIRKALGPHADSVSCSANKAQIGHLLGAAGAAELAITCLAIRDGFVPPTLNLDDPDPACDLDGTPHVGKARDIRTALKISIGFGGHLAAAVLRRPDGDRRSPVSPPPSPHD